MQKKTIKIKNALPPKFPKNYLRDRELFWEQEIKKYEKNNIPLWNGKVYFLNKTNNLEIEICLMEYKDLIFIEKFKVKKIQNKYNIDFNFIYLNVQIIIRFNNGEMLFGFQKFKNSKKIIAVGGTLRKENEKEIKNFNDIFDYAKYEIETETFIKIKEKNISYLGLEINNNIASFIFEYQNIDKKGNLLKLGEFDGEIILDKKDLMTDKFIFHSRFDSIKDFIIKLC